MLIFSQVELSLKNIERPPPAGVLRWRPPITVEITTEVIHVDDLGQAYVLLNDDYCVLTEDGYYFLELGETLH